MFRDTFSLTQFGFAGKTKLQVAAYRCNVQKVYCWSRRPPELRFLQNEPDALILANRKDHSHRDSELSADTSYSRRMLENIIPARRYDGD